MASTLSVTYQYRQSLKRFLVNYQFARRFSATSTDDGSLVQFRDATLAYPTKSTFNEVGKKNGISGVNLKITAAENGGHLLLSRNGKGKSLVTRVLGALGDDDHTEINRFLQKGSVCSAEGWNKNSIATVTFATHQEVLSRNWTAQKVITNGGHLKKAAQFLVVRLGLFPLLHRPVHTLSTGEIRKVLLIRALAQNPRLLVLDQALDGLDVESREHLLHIISQTLAGFRQDILVQGVDARNTTRTQILQITQRAEEIVNEMKTISYFAANEIKTVSRGGKSADECLQLGLGPPETSVHIDWEAMMNSEQVPGADSVRSWWLEDGAHNLGPSTPLLRAEKLSIQKGTSKIISDLDWDVWSGQAWSVSGPNGAGKSTLLRILAREFFHRRNFPHSITDEAQLDGSLQFLFPGKKSNKDIGGVAWVSTESHLQLANSTLNVSEFLHKKATPSSVSKVAQWLCLDYGDRNMSTLSTGEQKLVLIVAAIAQRPNILILDEVTQALDSITRQNVLALVEQIARETSISVLFVTHHQEEVPPFAYNMLTLG